MIIFYNRNSGYKYTMLNLRAYNTMHAIPRMLFMSLCLFFVGGVKGFYYPRNLVKLSSWYTI